MKQILAIVFAIALFMAGCQNEDSSDSGESTTWDAITHRTLGLAYLEENDLEQAESEFLELIALTPKEAGGYANLSVVYLRMGDLKKAQEYIQKAIDLEDDDVDILLIRSKILELNGKTDEAVRDLEKILDLDDSQIQALYSLSKNQEISIEQQIQYLNRIINVDQTNVVPLIGLSIALIDSNRLDSALATLERMAGIYPELPPESNQFYLKSIDEIRNGDIDGARRSIQILENFLKITPMYQSGLLKLEGPPGVLSGKSRITVSQTFGRTSPTSSIIEAIQFNDGSEGAGFNEPVKTLAIADYDNDGDQDLFFTSPQNKLRLLRNEIGEFMDVSEEVGLAGISLDAINATFQDFNNDGFLDVIISTNTGVFLLKNDQSITFESIPPEVSGLPSRLSKKSYLIDLDQEGDLDLIIIHDKGLSISQNLGNSSFNDISSKISFSNSDSEFSDLTYADFDEDGDLDIVLAAKTGRLFHFANNRMLSFQELEMETQLTTVTSVATITSGDLNNDGFTDLVISGSGGVNVLINKNGEGFQKPSQKIQFDEAIFDCNILDIDNDGNKDIAFASGSGISIWHNLANGSFEDRSSLIKANISRVNQILTADYNEDGDLDLFLIENQGNLKLLRNDGGNANHHLQIQLVGLRTGSGKNNHFGIGSKVELRVGDQYQMQTVKSPIVHFGLAGYEAADVVRIVWTNGVPQNIFTPLSNQDLVEEQILKGSCPFIYTWDGQQYQFFKDMMWKSALGMPMGIMAGETAFAFPDASREYLKIPGEKMIEKDGKLSIQLTAELWETVYFDQIKLFAIDYPVSTEIYVDEKFSPPPFGDLKLYHVDKKRMPISAKDQDGRDVLKEIMEEDDIYLNQFNLQAYQGVATTHELILDLGDLTSDDEVLLFLNGWIFPSDASLNLSIAQNSNISVEPLQLDVIDDEGNWILALPNLGFPMGKDKTIVADLTDKFHSQDYRVRIRTNMQIYWDHIFFSRELPQQQLISQEIPIESADLHFRGFSESFRLGGRYGPHWFDYSQTTINPKWRDLIGSYTRFGDVKELLLNDESMYVIANAGDEITVEFRDGGESDIPTGWKRDYLIYSVGWVKDGDFNTAKGQTVGPLPFHRMTQYPYDSSVEGYPNAVKYRNYQEKYNTRYVNPGAFQLMTGNQ